MTQRQAAELLGVSEVYVSQILRGLRTPALENALKIEETTGIPVRSWAQSEDSESADGPPTERPNVNIAK